MRPPSTAKIWPVTYGASFRKNSTVEDTFLQSRVRWGDAFWPKNGAGRDAIDPDGWGQFARHGLRQHLETSLCRGIHGVLF